MSQPPDQLLSGYAGRRARFEHDRPDQDMVRARLDRLCAWAGKQGLDTVGDLVGHLHANGIETDLPRLAALREPDAAPDTRLRTYLDEYGLPDDALALLERSLSGELAVAHFDRFQARLANMFAFAREYSGGELADYIPELAKQNPDSFGMAACTIDAQRFELGDASQPFCLQSVVKPLNYALAVGLNGSNFVHQHVGREPSGRRFNELALDPDCRPHNPMINSGAIMTCSMIRPGQPVEDRLNLVRRFVSSAAGGLDCGFDEEVYTSERDTADRNVALVELMASRHAFPEATDTLATLDLYFRTCALTLDCRALSVVAAMLANGGVCPLTGHRVIAADIVRDTLSLMLTCGMYDYSGEFAFTVGLPAKSGVSGGLMIVVPGVAGFGLWSPPLDRQGNPVRGVAFSRRLVDAYPFHIFAGVTAD
ncbi:glutaminase A [Maricaulis sp. CAU 1757]